jgi:alanyl-tRNA synthetase
MFGQEPGADGRGWVELWNLVFMQFDRQRDGNLVKLPAPSIDTGMGLERISCVLQNVVSNYDTDLLRPIVDLAASIARKRYGGTLNDDDVSLRVIADHARTTAILISEGVFPDRAERSYVLRRVMRRAIRHGHRLGIERLFLHECALAVADAMSGEYPELRERRALIEEITQQEESRFRQTLKRGLDRLRDYEWPAGKNARVLPGQVAFELYDTYGFPLDLQEVIGQESGFAIDRQGFDSELEKARERSAGSKLGEEAVEGVYRKLAGELSGLSFVGYEREEVESELVGVVVNGATAALVSAGQTAQLVVRETPFYGESGGQAGDRGVIEHAGARFVVSDTHKPLQGLVVHHGTLESGTLRLGEKVKLTVDPASRNATRRNHSATHLLHLALRNVVGQHAMQKGSLVGPDRLRFDYSGAQPLTAAQLGQIERLVNERILWNAEVTTEVLPIAVAKERGAIGIFEEKYGDTVRMLRIADSLELCGGTHVKRTGDIGSFKILSESGIAAGVRRIEAATGLAVLAYVDELQRELERTAELLKATPLSVFDRTEKLIGQRKDLQREIEQLKRQLISGGSRDLTTLVRRAGDVSVLGALVDIADPGALRELADQLRDKFAPAVIVLGAKQADDKALLVCTVSKELTHRFKAGQLIKEIASLISGSGGGRPDFAQAGGSEPARLPEAVEKVYALVSAA